MHNLPFHSLDDDSFNLEIFESNNRQINLDNDRFMSLNYDSLFANASQHLTLSNDLNVFTII